MDLRSILKRKQKIEKGDTILRYIKEIKTLCVLLHVCTLSLNVKHIGLKNQEILDAS